MVPENIPHIKKKLNDDPAVAFNLSSLAVIPTINAIVVQYPLDKANNRHNNEVNIPLKVGYIKHIILRQY